MTAKIDGTNGLLQNYDYQTPATGFSYTFTTSNTLVMNPAGTLATGTITMPASPSDGMTVTFSSTQTITALTVNANTGQTIRNAVTGMFAGQSCSYVYRAASTTWFAFSNVSASTTATPYGGPRAQLFLTAASGQTFTIPAGITSIKVTIQGGGGGGGNWTTCPSTKGGRGGTGGAGIQWFVGLTPGNTLTVNVGAGGAGSGSGNGSPGGTTSVASGTQTISTISATGGGGGTAGGGTSVGSTGTTSGITNNSDGAAGYQLVGGSTTYNPLNRGTGGDGQVGGGGAAGVAGAVLIEY